MSHTAALVERLAPLGRDEPSGQTLEVARVLLLDHLGVAIRGSVTPEATASRTMVRLARGGGDVDLLPVIGTDMWAPTLASTFANAVSAHSIEMDDVHNASSSHPGAVVWPAAMAAAVLAEADEATFLRGAIVGYEVMGRVGRAVNPAAHYARHFHPTGTVGTFAAAATAAAILGLDERETVMALGIAGSLAAGSLQFLVDGSWTKRLHPGNAARCGVEAALLAAGGYVGTDDGVGGPRAFLAGYTDEPRPGELLAGWGERPLEIVATSLKPHACCRYSQAALDALLALREEHGLDWRDCKEVVVGIPSAGIGIVAEPAERKRDPRSVVDAQFSLPFAAAVALVHGRAGLREHELDVIASEEVREVMQRVECVGDHELDRHYPDQWRAWARVATSGGTLESRVDVAKGDPDNALSPAEVRAKFEDLAGDVHDGAQRAAIASAVASMGARRPLRPFLGVLAAP